MGGRGERREEKKIAYQFLLKLNLHPPIYSQALPKETCLICLVEERKAIK
jgi:hypothetical protein